MQIAEKICHLYLYNVTLAGQIKKDRANNTPGKFHPKALAVAAVFVVSSIPYFVSEASVIPGAMFRTLSRICD